VQKDLNLDEMAKKNMKFLKEKKLLLFAQSLVSKGRCFVLGVDHYLAFLGAINLVGQARRALSCRS